MDAGFAFFLVICALFGVGGGLQGRSKGSSFLLWFFIAACLPLFGYLASVVYPGHRYEQRRQCENCGRLLPITDTMCMGCGTDLGFPEVRYLPEAVNPGPIGRTGADDDTPDAPDAPGDVEAGDDVPADGGDPENPYERAADAAGRGAPARTGTAPTT